MSRVNKPSPQTEIVKQWDLTFLIEIVGDDVKHPDEFLDDFLDNGRFIGVGSEADVLQSADTRFNSLCVKRVVRTTPRTMFSPGILNEMDLQYKACKILEELKMKQDAPLAKIPVPVVCYEDSDSGKKYILMEQVPGKTLWREILERVVGKMDENQLRGYSKDLLLSMQEDELADTLVNKILKLAGHELKQLQTLLNYLRGEEFIPQKFFQALQNTVQALNKNRFYHRDLHPRNIMISDEDIWLIDFGYSLFDPEEVQSNPYEESRLGENLAFSHDQGSIQLLSNFTIKTDDDFEAEKKQAIEEAFRDAERKINTLSSRSRSQIKQLIGQADSEGVDNVNFVRQVASDSIFLKDLRMGILSKDIDKILLYASILAVLEFKRFKTASATYDYLCEMIKQYQPKEADILLQKVRSKLKLYLNTNE